MNSIKKYIKNKVYDIILLVREENYMNINGMYIDFSEEDRELLGIFFSDNKEFIRNNSFLYYNNIKLLADLYENFIDENNLRDNDILMLFLAELRYDQISYKIASNPIEQRLFKKAKTPTIIKWYNESFISSYVSASHIRKLEKSMEPNLAANARQRAASEESVSKLLIR